MNRHEFGRQLGIVVTVRVSPLKPHYRHHTFCTLRHFRISGTTWSDDHIDRILFSISISFRSFLVCSSFFIHSKLRSFDIFISAIFFMGFAFDLFRYKDRISFRFCDLLIVISSKVCVFPYKWIGLLICSLTFKLNKKTYFTSLVLSFFHWVTSEAKLKIEGNCYSQLVALLNVASIQYFTFCFSILYVLFLFHTSFFNMIIFRLASTLCFLFLVFNLNFSWSLDLLSSISAFVT